MKKKTAKHLAVALVCSYLILIGVIAALWLLPPQQQEDTKQTLSEANASDNVTFGENDEKKQEDHQEDEVTSPLPEDNLGEEASKEEAEGEEETGKNIPKEPESNTVNLVFTGDVYIGNYVSMVYDSKGITSVLSEELISRFINSDLAMVNQEFPFSLRGEPMEDKQYTFRVDPKKVSLLTDLGIDVVSLANNHALDYGTDALLDSMETLEEAGITYVGVGSNLSEAKTTRYLKSNGKTIAILSASRVIPVSEWGATSTRPGMFTTYDPTALLEEIKAAREQADVVVVYLHWGLEKKEYPEDYQRVMGKQFIDAGADVVIGSHPHVLQGFEYYQGKLIVYSLGNFIFSQTIDSTALLSIDVDERNGLKYQIIPCTTVNGKTMELTDSEKIQEIYQYLSSISESAVIDDHGFIVE